MNEIFYINNMLNINLTYFFSFLNNPQNALSHMIICHNAYVHFKILKGKIKTYFGSLIEM